VAGVGEPGLDGGESEGGDLTEDGVERGQVVPDRIAFSSR
jgi:hypothetical protein